MVEKRPGNCQGWQFEDQKPQSAKNRPSNCQVQQFENMPVKLPTSMATFSIFKICQDYPSVMGLDKALLAIFTPEQT